MRSASHAARRRTSNGQRIVRLAWSSSCVRRRRAVRAAHGDVRDCRRPTERAEHNHRHGWRGPRDGRYELRRATMVDLIRTAHAVDADKVVGGPHWLELDRFDVIAKCRQQRRAKREADVAGAPRAAVRSGGPPGCRDIDGHALVRGTERSCGNRQPASPPAASSRFSPGGVSRNGGGPDDRDDPPRSRCAPSRSAAARDGLAAARSGIADTTGLSGTFDIDVRFSPPQLADRWRSGHNGLRS